MFRDCLENPECAQIGVRSSFDVRFQYCFGRHPREQLSSEDLTTELAIEPSHWNQYETPAYAGMHAADNALRLANLSPRRKQPLIWRASLCANGGRVLLHAAESTHVRLPVQDLVRARAVGAGTLWCMELWILHGSDDEAIRQRRRSLLEAAGESHEVVDLTEEPLDSLLNALSSPSLFSPRRVIALEGLSTLDEKAAKRLAETAKTSDAYVVARADAIPAAVLKPLKPFATEEKFTTPRNAAVKDRVREIARRHGVKLSAAVERTLVARAGHDLDRVASVCRQLELAGIANPSERQIGVLVGSTAPGGVPWAITDALEQGRFDRALEAAVGQEPMAVLGYLSNQVAAAARIAELETSVSDSRSVAAAIGVTPFVAEKAAWWKHALGEHIHDALAALARADALAKSAVGAENALAFALGRISVLLSHPR